MTPKAAVEVSQQAKGGDPSSPVRTGALCPHQQSCVQFWAPQHRKDVDLLQLVHHKATKIIKGMDV